MLCLKQLGLGKSAIAVILAFGISGATLAAQSDRPDDVRRLQRANEIFASVFNGPGSQVPQTIMRSGACVAIIPGYKTFGLGLGGGYGKGVAMCRGPVTPGASTATTPAPEPGADINPATNANGTPAGWSAPIFIAIGGANIGSQIGVESSDLVLVFQSRTGLENMLNNKVRLGVSAGAAAGPVGRHAEASTDASFSARVVGYAQSRGLYAGVNLAGAIVQPDESGNRAMYPHQYWQDVLDGKLATPAEARTLVSELDRSPYTQPLPPSRNARNQGAAGAQAASQPGGPALPIKLGPGERAPLPFEAGINWDHINSSPSFGGWNINGGWRPMPKSNAAISIVGEFSRNHNSQQVLTTTIRSRENTYLFGPEIDAPKRILDPFGHIMFGGARLRQDLLGGATPTSSTANTFAWQIGAGLKLNLQRYFTIRLIQIDLLHTSFNSQGSTDARYSMGAELRF